MIKHKLVCLAVASVFVVSDVDAKSVPVTTLQTLLGGTVYKNMTNRGYQAADPRFKSTFGALTGTITDWASNAAVIVGAAVSAPAWLTAGAIALGIPLAKEAGEYLGLAYAKWEWDRNHKDDVTIKADGKLPVTAPMTKGSRYAFYGSGDERMEASDPKQLARAVVSKRGGNYQAYACTYNNPGWMVCGVLKYNTQHQRWEHDGSISIELENDAKHECGPSSYWSKTGCATLPLEYPDGTTADPVTKPFNDAVKLLTQTELSKPVNPALLANLLNHAWEEAAAKPGYQGIPYDYAHPITETEVETWAQENGITLPTISDFVEPRDPATKPWLLPTSGTPATSYDPDTDTVGTNPAGTQPQVNLGNDPAIPFPQMEEIPTAEMILKPILSLMPDLRNFSVPASGASCPMPTFNVFERTFRLDKHCELAENNRVAIKAAMVAFFALASFLTVLRA